MPDSDDRPDAVPASGSPPRAGGEPPDGELLATSPFDDDLDAALAAVPAKRALPGPTLYLAAGLLLVVGFLGGIQAQKWRSDDSGGRSGNGMAQAGEGFPGGARGGYGSRAGGESGGMPGFGGAPGGGYGGAYGGRGGFGGAGVTAGTVVKVSGDTLWVKTSDGKTVKVHTSDSTKVSVTKQGSLKDFGSGATVVVRGSAGDDGTVTATQVTEGGGRGN
ncbi:hypothetical protein [Actinomadura atramentaria]|uniref:hypothetical protein n=1 Tax=Actinomadura atramentaria TaxID=1990 RepID=UPI00036573EA|nr:hypothetical protein [Actinomadura atramentaria]